MNLLRALNRGQLRRSSPLLFTLRTVALAPVAPRHDVTPKQRWTWDGITVSAHTKSEARAELKRRAGLDRLPDGAVIERVQMAVS